MNELTTEDKINFRMLELEARIAEIEKAIDVTSGGFKRELERENQRIYMGRGCAHFGRCFNLWS